MLTGRAFGYYDNNRFQEISGYSSPAESPEYDQFELGHTSTSISLASGLQKARDIKGTKENIVVVIGDGSLSGGEALEGLDEVGELGTGIIIVVNDNEMSIAENHGGTRPPLKVMGWARIASRVTINRINYSFVVAFGEPDERHERQCEMNVRCSRVKGFVAFFYCPSAVSVPHWAALR